MKMINILLAIIFGIIEGISEWLPISSTAHMMIFNEFVNFEMSDSFYRIFEVVIQLGAIIAVIIYLWKKIFPFNIQNKKIIIKKDIISLWFKIIVACIPAMIIGILFDDKIDELFYNPTTISLALIIVGIIFIIVEQYIKNKDVKYLKLEDIDYKIALYIGLFQVIAAIFPGTSRSGATIIGALLLGVSRVAAVEFTFILAIPVMFGASLLKLIKANFLLSSFEILIIIVGCLSAFIVSILVIKKLLDYIKNHNFKIFGYYRIILGIIFILLFIIKL